MARRTDAPRAGREFMIRIDRRRAAHRLDQREIRAPCPATEPSPVTPDVTHYVSRARAFSTLPNVCRTSRCFLLIPACPSVRPFFVPSSLYLPLSRTPLAYSDFVNREFIIPFIASLCGVNLFFLSIFFSLEFFSVLFFLR